MHIIPYMCSVITVRRRIQYSICYLFKVIVIRCLVQHKVAAAALYIYLSAIGVLHDQMPKTCYYVLKSRICKYELIPLLLAYIFVKKGTQEDACLLCIFFCNHNYLGGTGEFIYKANKQLLRNMMIMKPQKCNKSPELPSW